MRVILLWFTDVRLGVTKSPKHSSQTQLNNTRFNLRGEIKQTIRVYISFRAQSLAKLHDRVLGLVIFEDWTRENWDAQCGTDTFYPQNTENRKHQKTARICCTMCFIFCSIFPYILDRCLTAFVHKACVNMLVSCLPVCITLWFNHKIEIRYEFFMLYIIGSTTDRRVARLPRMLEAKYRIKHSIK